MSRLRVAVVGLTLVGCHQSRPVTNTSGAVYAALCAATTGVNMAQTKPTKITVHVSTELAATASNSVRSVTPMSHRNDASGPHTVGVEIEVDPTTIHCDLKQMPPRFRLTPDGDLTQAPAE